MNKVVVYTAIMGKFDNLKDPLVITPNVDYICFTDNPKVKSKTWKVILLDKLDNSRLHARKLKILGHELLNDYEYSIWVDGNILITNNLTELIEQYFYKEGIEIATFKHPIRNCIYEEAIECAVNHADNSISISRHLKFLVNNNYPVNNGLVESNVLFKKNKSKALNDFIAQWWYFVENITIRDQLSFNFVLNDINIKFNYLPGNSRGDSKDFSWYKHQNKSIIHRVLNKIFSFILSKVK